MQAQTVRYVTIITHPCHAIDEERKNNSHARVTESVAKTYPSRTKNQQKRTATKNQPKCCAGRYLRQSAMREECPSGNLRSHREGPAAACRSIQERRTATHIREDSGRRPGPGRRRYREARTTEEEEEGPGRVRAAATRINRREGGREREIGECAWRNGRVLEERESEGEGNRTSETEKRVKSTNSQNKN